MRQLQYTLPILACLTLVPPIVVPPEKVSAAETDMLSAVLRAFEAPKQTPHPAVAQVFVRESDSLSSGSGTLIYVDAKYGYVLTNWHVVRSKEQKQPLVRFPDGFQSAAIVLKTDETWDSALLRIWRPQVSPMPISGTVPVVGEELVIAGYGQGTYRAARGQCRYYAAPDSHSPQDMIEVSVAARQGDSGGPIINRRGELAAVLFGSGRGMTTGTHVGRIVSFVNSVSLETASTQLAAHVTTADDPQRSSLIASGSENLKNGQPQENVAAAAAKQLQYYKLPPLEWSTPVDNSPFPHDGAADDFPVFPGEQTPQPAVAALLSTPRLSATSVDHQNASSRTAIAPLVAVTGDQLPGQSITAIDPRPNAPRPKVALPPTVGHGNANVFGGVSDSSGVSNHQGIRSSGFVPALNHNVMAREEEIITLPNLGGGDLLHHLKSLLAIIGIVALLDRIRKR